MKSSFASHTISCCKQTDHQLHKICSQEKKGEERNKRKMLKVLLIDFKSFASYLKMLSHLTSQIQTTIGKPKVVYKNQLLSNF